MNWNKRKDLINILEKRVLENLCEFQHEYMRKLDHVEYETINRILEELRFIQKSLKENNPDSFTS
jgi:hypothetical protein